MEPMTFVRALQVTDSFFPVGAFAYSDGLESAASDGRVHDITTLAAWMDHFLEWIFIPCEGLAVAKSIVALKKDDFEELRHLDEELMAIRPSRSVRTASVGIGKRMLSLFGSTVREHRFTEKVGALPCGNAAVAYALVYFHVGLSAREAVLAYGYNRLAGIVSAGLRLISIGQQQGQELLTQTSNRLPAAADFILQSLNEPLRSFSPLVDVAQMNQQYVYSRLFRS
jgi:urease accessory protein